ncbi:hypothetical protein J4526_00390 [Desulfurococcaceae archaeon MEX13E-LK6-19]|nr:hypothetical protein J4526_00390 [Desulfurococcaceae archaeon MEX13E-LK6-19]
MVEKENSIDYSEIIPEDVLREVEEAEKEYHKKKTKYLLPSSRDIVEAVIEATSRARGIHPDEFPELVYSILEEQGFSTKYVTIKRIWRIYETLVLRGVIRDVLGVVHRYDDRNRG